MPDRRIRLIVWIVAGVVACFVQGPALRMGRAVPLAALGVIFFLLMSTPADAIRLPRWVSEILILLIGVGLRLISDGSREILIHSRLLNNVGLHSIRLRDLCLIGSAVLMFMLRRWRKSAWWASLLAWLPTY